MHISNTDNKLRSTDSFLPLSDQDFRVLLILNDGPLHGYGIVKASAEQNDPAGPLELGSLYRIVARMSRDGLIAEEEDRSNSKRKRRLYSITDLGRRVAVAEANRLQRLLKSRQAMDLLHG